VVAVDAALGPLAPGETIHIAHDGLSVEIAPAAGGRIAQITRDDLEWLVGYSAANPASIDWGSFPMLPWAGRIRRGSFDFDGNRYQLSPNLGAHAIHGIAFGLPWHVDTHSPSHVELSLQLPEGEHWPFGGIARQRIAIARDTLRLALSVTAQARAMPVVIGWHPWLRKPDRMGFAPSQCYPRDAEGIATLPLVKPPPRPWDDCFINRRPVIVQRGGQTLRLRSDCTHWVMYDEPEDATCIEPQSGPPDAFNLEPSVLAPGATRAAWYLWEWL